LETVVAQRDCFMIAVAYLLTKFNWVSVLLFWLLEQITVQSH